jgi:hypothetical protein
LGGESFQTTCFAHNGPENVCLKGFGAETITTGFNAKLIEVCAGFLVRRRGSDDVVVS